ncbi:hypothetical protein B7463_g5684, partial [Scytalidium lignicola]
MDRLAIAQLAIYAIISPLILFIAIRHGRLGALGWFYCFAFCTLRLIGNGMQVSASKNGTTNSTAAIISSIGLSPLLLATGGILHEARIYRQSHVRIKIEWILTLLIHIIVTTGLAIVASGASAFKVENHSNDLNLAKIGILILLISWFFIFATTLFSFLPHQQDAQAVGYRDGSLLIYGVMFSLPFTCIRLTYATISIFVGSASLNQVTGSLAVRVCLSMLPELITIMTFMTVGLMTRNTRQPVYETANSSTPTPNSGRHRKNKGNESAIGLRNIRGSASRD